MKTINNLPPFELAKALMVINASLLNDVLNSTFSLSPCAIVSRILVIGCETYNCASVLKINVLSWMFLVFIDASYCCHHDNYRDRDLFSSFEIPRLPFVSGQASLLSSIFGAEPTVTFMKC